ncbi:MAG: hypothetical protein ACTHMI_16570 [Mucilaginibacter sp.]
MQNITIEIQAPDFSFEEIAKDKAQSIIRFHLYGNGLIQYVSGGNHELGDRVEAEIGTLYNKTEQLVCISELITFLTDNVIQFNNNPYNGYSDKDKKMYAKGINKLKYILYSLATTTCGYSFDTNSFTNEEVTELSQKIDKVLSELETIKMGNEVLGDMIDELKDEISSLKSSYVLGKKTWKQKATGIFVSFAGNKGGDAIWDAIKPHLKDFMINDAPEFIHKLLS